MGIFNRIVNAIRKKAADTTWTVQTAPWNYWQFTGAPSATDAGSYGPVYACWAILSQEVSRIPLRHVIHNEDGSDTPVKTRAPYRVFRKPNQYQTRSDFLLYLMRSLLADGNAYARVVRNDRFEIASLHPLNPRMCWPHIDMTNGDIYYHASDSYEAALSGVSSDLWVPARDMLHIRLFTPTHPLIGETPLVAAALSVQAGQSINGQVASFFQNMSRPSGIIRHPGKLEPAAILRIKERFKEATNGARAGDPVVFTENMEWSSLTMSAVDAELIASSKMTQIQIAQVYRVPPFMLGDLESAKFATVESMTKWFINSGLGFYLDHISDSLTSIFNLGLSEEIEFDYEAALFRSDFKQFMDALEVGTRSGVLSPNEARRLRKLPPVEDGDEPRVQQQLVPLSYGMKIQPQVPVTVPVAAAAEDPETEDPEDPGDETEDPEDTAATAAEERAVRVELMRRRLLGVATC
jgi:HK97 family phage portal protein